MTIKEIYKMQKDLDDLIIKKKELDVDNKTLLNTRLLALFVELGEYEEEAKNWFANLKYLNPLGNPTSKEKALEEYVDCMHFIFSIANALDIEGYMEDLKLSDVMYVPRQFNFIIAVSDFANYVGTWKYWKKEITHDRELLYTEWLKLLDNFIDMGINRLPTFTIAEIEEAYKAKMKKNYERQENNY